MRRRYHRGYLFDESGLGESGFMDIGKDDALPAFLILVREEVEAYLEPGQVVIVSIINDLAMVYSLLQFHAHRHRAQCGYPVLNFFSGEAKSEKHQHTVKAVFNRRWV